MSRRLVPAALCAASRALARSTARARLGAAADAATTAGAEHATAGRSERTETRHPQADRDAPRPGTVTSQPRRHRLRRSTCVTTSVSVSRTCLDDDCDELARPRRSWTLTASGGPAGYSAIVERTAPATAPARSRSATRSRAGSSRRCRWAWVDTTAPSTAFAPPAKVGPSNYNVTAGATDNSGSIADVRLDRRRRRAGRDGLRALALRPRQRHAQRHRALARRRGQRVAAVTKNVAVDKAVVGHAGRAPRRHERRDACRWRSPRTPTSSSASARSTAGAYATCASGWSGITAGHRRRRAQLPASGSPTTSATSPRAPRVTTVIDRTLPVLAFTDGPAEGQQVVTRNAAITFSLTEARIATVKCKLDDGAWNGLHAGHRGRARRPRPTARTCSRSRRSTPPATPARSTAPSASRSPPRAARETPTGGGGDDADRRRRHQHRWRRHQTRIPGTGGGDTRSGGGTTTGGGPRPAAFASPLHPQLRVRGQGRRSSRASPSAACRRRRR